MERTDLLTPDRLTGFPSSRSSATLDKEGCFEMTILRAVALAIVGVLTLTTRGTEQDRRGCCSHHGGVCGCATEAHTLKCCDGALSVSCGC
jgi:hypothetical protein